MDISELIKNALVKKNPRRYSGTEDYQLSCRVTENMLRDLDAIAIYLSISRSDALRSILSEQLPILFQACDNQGRNADGHTIQHCRPSGGYPTAEEASLSS